MTSPTPSPGDADHPGTVDPDAGADERPEFGPGGYLPGRAARRARKIILRAPLGVQWIVASIVAGVIVLVAGALFLTRSGDAPGEPFVEVGPVAAIGDAEYRDDLDVLVVGAGGRIRAFAAGPGVGYCPASRRLEDGASVWSLTGRSLDGGTSLAERVVVVVDGIAYLDPTSQLDTVPGTDEGVEPAC